MKQDHIFIGLRAEGGRGSVKDCKILELCAIRTDSFGMVSGEVYSEVDLENLSSDETPFVVVAHFAEVKREIIRAKMSLAGKLFTRSWLCTSQLAWPMAYAGIQESRKLEDLAKFYAIENPSPGSARGDAHVTMGVYWQMMRRYKTALKTENFLTEKLNQTSVGQAIEGTRRMLGF